MFFFHVFHMFFRKHCKNIALGLPKNMAKTWHWDFQKTWHQGFQKTWEKHATGASKKHDNENATGASIGLACGLQRVMEGFAFLAFQASNMTPKFHFSSIPGLQHEAKNAKGDGGLHFSSIPGLQHEAKIAKK